jgi:hypothetical protein
VSNGNAVLPDVDGRSRVARKFYDIASAIATDQGGIERLAEVRLQLVRRFAACAVLAEQLEADLANGQQIDVAEHALLCSSLVRIATRIGLGRREKNITPSLAHYLEHPADTEDDE